jgi:outer membrane protein assembly factor BamD (BamD/ComL family)
LNRWPLKFLILSFLFCTYAGWLCPSSAVAKDAFTLLSVTKQDEVNVTKFILQFNRLPKFQIKTSGQRLEIELLATVTTPFPVLPPTDERLVQILVGQAKDKLVLAFLLRRPPYFVNGVKDERDNRMVIAVHWRDTQIGTRPAISADLPGNLSVRTNGGAISRVIASKYKGRWDKFFSEYERAVQVQGPMVYTVAPFPCLALVDSSFDYIPLEAAEFARCGDWRAALTAMENVGLENTDENGTTKVKRLLFRADIHQRAGHNAEAQRALDSARSQLGSGQDELAACAALQQLYINKDLMDSPYELLAEMDMIKSPVYPQAFQGYFDLFQAEVALSAGDLERSKILLDEGLQRGVGLLSERYQLRLADMDYARGDYGGAIEQYSSLGNIVEQNPYSLSCYATSLYRTKNYDDAIRELKVLLTTLSQAESRDMVRYLMALALMHRGDNGAGVDLLQQILPGTQGAQLAKAKLADLNVTVDDLYRRQQALETYAELNEEIVDRDGSAEMQFKHALALYLLGQQYAALDELRFFLRIDHLSELRAHAQALLAEILPEAIHRLVQEEKYFEALVLVEKNRDLLIASHREFNFLVELGYVFDQLNNVDSAVRLYLYLLDRTKPGEKQEEIFVPLIGALLQQKDYVRVKSYTEQYQNKYPQGKAFAQVFFLQLQALLAQEKGAEALEMLQQNERPQSVAINRLAANLAWQDRLLTMAQKNIDAVVGTDLKKAEPEDLLLQAEILLALGNDAAALLRYQLLDSVTAFADQALYREGSILLRRGLRAQGLKLLQQLVDKGKQDQWHELAQETLKIERLSL